jgi:hypothetical protein
MTTLLLENYVASGKSMQFYENAEKLFSGLINLMTFGLAIAV